MLFAMRRWPTRLWKLRSPCSEMAQALNALADNAEKTLNLIFDTLSEIISLLKLIAGELIIPGAGPVLATVTVAAEVTQAIQWASDIVEYLNNLYEALNGLCVCLMVMQRLSVKNRGHAERFWRRHVERWNWQYVE